MRLADVDWAVLRGALAMLVVALVTGGGALAGGYHFWDRMQKEYRAKNTELVSVRSRYQSIDEEERLIELYLPTYRTLEEQGIIGREHRLDWIEALREASRDMKLPGLRYSIDSQTAYKPEFPVETGAFEVFASNMTLDLGLLHEGDLPDVLRRIDGRAPGLYSVSKCTIARAVPELGRDPTKANLRALCDLRWYTVRRPESEAGS